MRSPKFFPEVAFNCEQVASDLANVHKCPMDDDNLDSCISFLPVPSCQSTEGRFGSQSQTHDRRMSDRKVSVITGTTTNHYYTVWTQPTVIQCGGDSVDEA